jgi:hypothetical protein
MPVLPKFRFSLRTGVALFLLCCIAFGFAARWYHATRAQAAVQRRLILRSKSKPYPDGFTLSVVYAAEKSIPWFTRVCRQFIDPDALRRIDGITISDNHLDKREIASEIAAAHAIDSLQIYCTTMSREFAEGAFRAPQLRRLGIFCEQVDDAGEDYLDALPQALALQDLSLNSPFLSRRGAALLARLPELTFLTVYACEPESVVTLASAPKLTTLTIQSLQPARDLPDGEWAEQLHDTYSPRVRQMFDALAENPHLLHLDITGPLAMNPFELDEFCRRSRIESLSLRDCKLGGTLLEIVAAMPHLKHLVIYDEEIRDDDLAAIAAAKKLEHLTIGPRISEGAIESLRKAMPTCTIGVW